MGHARYWLQLRDDLEAEHRRRHRNAVAATLLIALTITALLFVGCTRVPPRPVPPSPEPEVPVAEASIDGLTGAFNAELRAAYLKGAAKLRSGEWKTATDYVSGQTALIDDAFDRAAQPLADREQAETGKGWSPAKSATYLESIAREGRQ